MDTAASSTYSSGSLVRRITAMDKTAWDQFVDLYGPLIHRWCLQSGLGSADAADLVQDVFTVVIKSISNFHASSTGTFRGWLWTITRNKIRDFFRQSPSRLLPTGGTDLQLQLSQQADPIDVFDDETTLDPTERSQAVQLMHRAMQTIENDFAPKTWQAFMLAVVHGQRTSDIAVQLEMSSNNVRQAKSRVLRRLRQQLGEF